MTKYILTAWCFCFAIVGLSESAFAAKMQNKWDKKLIRNMPWEGSVCSTNADCHTELTCAMGQSKIDRCLKVQADKCDLKEEVSIRKAYDRIGCRNVSLCVSRSQKSLWEKRFNILCERSRVKQKKYFAAYVIGRIGPAIFLTINDTTTDLDTLNLSRSWIANMPFFEPVMIAIETKFTDIFGLRTAFGGNFARTFQINGPTCYDSLPQCNPFLFELVLNGGFFLSFAKDSFQLSFNVQGVFQQAWLGVAHASIKLEDNFVGPLIRMRFKLAGDPAKHAFVAIELEGGIAFNFKDSNKAVVLLPYVGLKLTVYLVPFGFTWF
ncbi:hypothetical protein KKC60_00825 [Patescibacteria group bacterium]|nr:hypothetical protein [Patescibacteria group bacterium]